MQNFNRNKFQAYPYHMVTQSPWPILTSWAVFSMAIGAVMSFHGYNYGPELLNLGVILTVSAMILWFRDITTEGTYLGDHTKQVQKGLTIGVALFIVSEAFAFLSVFWAFFHASLAPTIEIGQTWPPLGIQALDPFAIPSINTVLLLSSGIICPKWDIQGFSNFCLVSGLFLPFSTPRVPSHKRIGPHDFEVLSLLIGSLLGDGHMERDGNGSRFAFYQDKCHGEYLLWLHHRLFNLGYCKLQIPAIQTRLSVSGNLRYYFRFRTFTFSSFNWIYEAFYINNRKILPQFISEYLSPLTLAIWIMDDGTLVKNKGLSFASHSFTLEECKFLQKVLLEKYGLESSLHKITGKVNQYGLYILKSSLSELTRITRPFIHPTMLYKIGE